MSYPMEPKRWAQLLKLRSYPRTVTPELAVFIQAQEQKVVWSVFSGFSLFPRLLIMSLPDARTPVWQAQAKEGSIDRCRLRAWTLADSNSELNIAVPGFEPGLPDSESGVLTTTLYRS